jgi:hypothetical protein
MDERNPGDRRLSVPAVSSVASGQTPGHTHRAHDVVKEADNGAPTASSSSSSSGQGHRDVAFARS